MAGFRHASREGCPQGRYVGMASRAVSRDQGLDELSLATRRQRENIFKQVLETAGHQPFAKITTATIIAGRDRRASDASTSAQFPRRHARPVPLGSQGQAGKVDPTVGVDNPPRPKTQAFRFGAKTTSPPMRRAGRSARGNGSGSMFWSIPAYVVATQCGSVASMSAMASAPSRPRRPTPRSRCRSCRFCEDARRRTVRRPDVHRWREWSSAHQRSRSAMCSARHAARPACATAPRMDCARSQRRAPRMPARRSRSLKRSSAGTVARWRRYTRALPIVDALRLKAMHMLGERLANFYSLTLGPGEGARAKRGISKMRFIWSGGPGRTRTSNQAVMDALLSLSKDQNKMSPSPRTCQRVFCLMPYIAV